LNRISERNRFINVKREFKARLILASALIGGMAFAAEPRITLSAENQPLGQVLQSIEKQSGFSVVLNDKKWSEDIVTLSVKNLELEKALGVVFGGYNYVLSFEADKGEVSKVLVTVYEKKAGSDEVVAGQSSSPAVADNKTAAQRGIEQMEAGLAKRTEVDAGRTTAPVLAVGAVSSSSDRRDMKNAMEQLANKINERR